MDVPTGADCSERGDKAASASPLSIGFALFYPIIRVDHDFLL
jgi:hypothetical protein